MEVKEKSKKRELIKTIAIIFLAVMLVLTFFSNTFLNRSLPEVATKSISSGTITAKIRGNGTVSAEESYEVILNQTREIRSVCVKVGDAVAKGDLLFVLEDAESQELQDAQDQLRSLNIDYQKQLLNLSKEYAGNDRTITALRAELDEATSRRDANLISDAEIAYAKGDLAQAKTELSQIKLILEELNDEMTGNEAYQEAQTAVTKWTAEVEKLEDKVDALEVELGKVNGADLDLTELNSQVQTAKLALGTAELAKKDAYSESNKENWASLEKAAKDYVYALGKDIRDEIELAYYMEFLTTRAEGSAYAAAYKAITEADAAYEKAFNEFTTLNELLISASGNSDAYASLKSQLDAAKSDLSYAESQLRRANKDLSDATGDNAALKEQIKLYEGRQRDADYRIELLTQTVADQESRKAAYDAAVETIAAKEQAIADALSGKDIDKQLDNLDLETMRIQIQKQQEVVDKLKKNTLDTEVKANVSGTVSAINVSAGRENQAGAAMAVIDVTDRGYTMKISVTSEQAKQVKVGDKADVTNYYWGNNMEATLEAITADPANPGKGKLLVFRITGDVDPGSSLTLSIGQRSANYDAIIPKSALRSDTNGDFVLVVMAKSTPLGNRYIATRVDVQILASDDTRAAVSGLSGGDYVITTSSKPLEAGTQVRMEDNA